MKELFKYLLVFALVVFSFFYTDKISKIIIYKSELMKEILNNKESYEIESVDAVIDGNTIIPGLNGTKINELESYYNMKEDNKFNDKKIIYEEIYPGISIFDNENLTINKGNSLKRSVAIITNNQNIVNYAKESNIIISSYTKNINIDGKNYYINPSKSLKNDSLYNIESGDIIYLDNNYLLDNFKMLIKKIKYQDYKIISLEDLLSEKRL